MPYLARASMKSATSGTIVNVNGPDKTLDAGADLAQRLGQRGRYTSYIRCIILSYDNVCLLKPISRIKSKSFPFGCSNAGANNATSN